MGNSAGVSKEKDSKSEAYPNQGAHTSNPNLNISNNQNQNPNLIQDYYGQNSHISQSGDQPKGFQVINLF